MKSLTLILIFLTCYFISSAQDGAAEIEKIKKETADHTRDIGILKVKTDTLQSKIAKVPIACKECLKDLGWLWLYVLLPILLFIFFGLYFIRWLRKDGYKIADALSNDLNSDQLDKLQATANSTAGFVANPILNRSSSRLIAFLSSLSAVILAICLFSYYMYFSIKGLTPPDFEKLWTILAAIGIGVVPYASKVISQSSQTAR
jgi:hypothetical protein